MPGLHIASSVVPGSRVEPSPVAAGKGGAPHNVWVTVLSLT